METSERGFAAQFFRDFQDESAALETLMTQLEAAESPAGQEDNTTTITAIVEECLGRITRLSTRVQDASSALPTYDQRTYSNGIKALSERLQRARAARAPKQRFAFRAAARGKGTSQQPVRRSILPVPSSASASAPTTSSSSSTTTTTIAQGSVQTSSSSVRASSIENPIIADRAGELITIAAHPTPGAKPITLTDLEHCIVRPRQSAAAGPPQFTSSLTITNLDSSLLILPPITGPAHMTRMTNCTLVLRSRQFRLHSCRNVDVYVHCSSRPIVEDCEGIRFAPLEGEVRRVLFGEDKEKDDAGGGGGSGLLNRWDQVDDFNWIRPGEHSPNWRVLKGEERIAGDGWREVLASVEEGGHVSGEQRVEEVLRKTLPVR
ncbi:MAG: hypothetical protein M1816_004129 [Peltula sp. TS41687]|nr:MAG: hypothetical protein M1816_004129 [Peltula sp. TS41687]